MSVHVIEPAQHRAARIIGLLYLILMATGVFAEFYARGTLIVPDDPARTATSIVASETLFRWGILSNLITFAGGVPLLWALYIVLKPVDRNLALLAAFWRVAECAAVAAISVSDYTVLQFLTSPHAAHAFDAAELHALARVFIGVQASAYRVAMVFFALGSALFCWLWIRSRYIPRPLAALGLFGALTAGLVTMAIMVYPSLGPVVTPFYYLPIFLFEVTIGFWLLAKGLR